MLVLTSLTRDQQTCGCCGLAVAVNNILVECTDLQLITHTQKKHFTAYSLKYLFESVVCHH